jgi:hypothetical protein
MRDAMAKAGYFAFIFFINKLTNTLIVAAQISVLGKRSLVIYVDVPQATMSDACPDDYVLAPCLRCVC